MKSSGQNITIKYEKQQRARSFDDQVRGVLGMGLAEFIRELRDNEGGKYDALYIQK